MHSQQNTKISTSSFVMLYAETNDVKLSAFLSIFLSFLSWSLPAYPM